jgi:hypothetical protein
MATTEPRTDVITASHKRALRNADSIVFELTSDGQAQIRAIKRAEYSTTGFDQTVTIYVGGARVSDYGKQTKHYPEQHTYTAFHMEMNSSMDNTVRTLVNRVKIGGFMNLVWTRDNNNELLRHAGLHQDELRLVVSGPEKDGKLPPADTYLVEIAVRQDNSARMIKRD